MARWRIAMAVALAPLTSMALEPSADFHRCQADTDCVLVEGICGKAAVNVAYAQEATDYYTRARADGDAKACKSVFWRPNPNGVRCKLESCEAIAQ